MKNTIVIDLRKKIEDSDWLYIRRLIIKAKDGDKKAIKELEKLKVIY